jgi:rare lipoprotein A
MFFARQMTEASFHSRRLFRLGITARLRLMRHEAIQNIMRILGFAVSSRRRLFLVRKAILLGGLGVLAGCSAQNSARYASEEGAIDPRYGVRPSQRVIAEGEEVPPGGGRYLVGNAYQIAGKTYYPNERPIVAVGTASWYGSDFHGRRTANGEIFNRNSISAAHPTMPLPSYARVTNLRNARSIIVRVNDRGPYHGGRVMDVSQRTAEALDFRASGTTRVKVEYVRRASLAGSDDNKLMATLRDDGQPAMLEGEGQVMTAAFEGSTRTASVEQAGAEDSEALIARAYDERGDESGSIAEEPTAYFARTAPLPPIRPASFGSRIRRGVRQALNRTSL